MSNFEQISQSTADILLLLFAENKQPSYWNSISSFYFDLSLSSVCSSPSAYQISPESDHLQQNYDVMAIFKMAAIASQIYFRFLVWPRLTFKKVSLLAYQISTRYLNPRPRYYYFRFLKTDGRQILLRFLYWSFHCHWHAILHWPTNFYANWMIVDGFMVAYRFYKMAAIASQVYFRFLVWPRHTFKKV